MITVAVCDDNKFFLDVAMNIIRDQFRQMEIEHKIEAFLSGNEFLDKHKNVNYDVVFLDIAMPDINGFDVAKEMRRISEKTYIIFVTTESSLVYDSFDFQPFGFVPKEPSDNVDNRLSHIIKKIAERLLLDKPICFSLPYGESQFVAPQGILYVRSSGNYIDFTLRNNEVIHMRGSMATAEKLLPQRYFVRIHNRCIVNMQHISKIDYPNSSLNVEEIINLEISRKYKSVLEEKYKIYLRNFC